MATEEPRRGHSLTPPVFDELMWDEEMNQRIKDWFASLTPEQQEAFNERTARLWVALEEEEVSELPKPANPKDDPEVTDPEPTRRLPPVPPRPPSSCS